MMHRHYYPITNDGYIIVDGTAYGFGIHLQGVMEELVEDQQTAYQALRRIAEMPTEPRSDGTFNYSRAALIDIARDAIAMPVDPLKRDVQDNKTCRLCGDTGRKARMLDDDGNVVRGWQCLGKECVRHESTS